jgi:hypothetical protein
MKKRSKPAKRNLTLDDFLETSYGQTRKQAEADYKYYLETGEIT